MLGAMRCLTKGVDATVRTGRGARAFATAPRTVLGVVRVGAGAGAAGVACATGAVGTICTGAAGAGAAVAVLEPPRLGVWPQTTSRERDTRGTQFTFPSTPARMYTHPLLSTYWLAVKDDGGNSAGPLSRVSVCAFSAPKEKPQVAAKTYLVPNMRSPASPSPGMI